MDALTEHLDKFSEDETLTPAVRMAAKRGRILLDKYYGLTDETIIYRIAMSALPFPSSSSWPSVADTTYFSPAPAVQDQLLPHTGVAGGLDHRGGGRYPRRMDFALQACSIAGQGEGPRPTSFACPWAWKAQRCGFGERMILFYMSRSCLTSPSDYSRSVSIHRAGPECGKPGRAGSLP